MNLEISITKIKKMKDGLFIQEILRPQRLPTDWYLWMHHTIDKIPDKK